METPTQEQFEECLSVARERVEAEGLIRELLPVGQDLHALGDDEIKRRLATIIEHVDEQREPIVAKLQSTYVHRWLLSSKEFGAAVNRAFPGSKGISGREWFTWPHRGAHARRADFLYDRYAEEVRGDDPEETESPGPEWSSYWHDDRRLRQMVRLGAEGPCGSLWYLYTVTAIAEYSKGGGGERALAARRGIDRCLERMQEIAEELGDHRESISRMGLAFTAFERLPISDDGARLYDKDLFPLKSATEKADEQLFVFRMYWANSRCLGARKTAVIEAIMRMDLFGGYDRRNIERQCTRHDEDRDARRAQYAEWRAAELASRRGMPGNSGMSDGSSWMVFPIDTGRV